MKKMITVLSLFASLAGWTQTTADLSINDLVGTWRNSKGNGLDIVDSTTVYIVHGSQRKLASATVSDVQKNPVDFTLTVKDSTKSITLKGVLLVVSDDILQWQVFDSDTRPVSYSFHKRDMLFMKRIKNLVN